MDILRQLRQIAVAQEGRRTCLSSHTPSLPLASSPFSNPTVVRLPILLGLNGARVCRTREHIKTRYSVNRAHSQGFSPRRVAGKADLHPAEALHLRQFLLLRQRRAIGALRMQRFNATRVQAGVTKNSTCMCACVRGPQATTQGSSIAETDA